jgi:DNA polymerase III alpha subunit
VKTNQYGQIELTEQEIFNSLYNKTITNLNGIYIDQPDQYNTAVKTNADPIDLLRSLPESIIGIEQFDANLQDNWFMPEGYKSNSFDIVSHLLDKCTTDIERNRVLEELELFAKNDMIELLCYLRYLVDTMKEHDIVWGVGRGSSVASYCLYLLNVHRIDSIKYNLDIREFFK